jgi:predicted nucleic acid-binding protein
MRKQKVYIETTLFNFYFDDDRGFAHESTLALFKEIAAGKYEAFTSDYVIDELEKAPTEKQEKMLKLISEYNIVVLTYNDSAEALANIYITEGAIPATHKTDALHIATAAVNDLDLIISMNFQHIVKRKTKYITGNINVLNGYRAVEIFNPMEVIENEND